jgi:two-component system, OmpR family, sensor histidine kinase CiaH
MSNIKEQYQKIKLSNLFEKARLVLTAYYVIAMFIILMIFSSVLIFTVESKVRESFDGSIVVREENDRVFKKLTNEIEILIYTIDAGLLLLIGGASYFLAGKTLRPIKDNMEAQKKFLANASHDLRTPVAIITTESEVILQDKNIGVKDYRDAIESNLEEAKKMSVIINGLLFMARGEAEIKIREKLNLSLLLKKIIDKMNTQARQKDLVLHSEINQDIFIMSNTSDMERAINNILQNAINYTKIGKIEINLKQEKNKILLEIIDTGVGIKEKDLPFIFDRFFKAEHSRNDGAGSGLGLHIAKETIERNGGQIKIESKLGVGTKTSVYF